MPGYAALPASRNGTMTESTARAPETGPNTGTEPAADQLAALTKEIAELKDRHLRTLADMENLRKRSEREAAEARLYFSMNFARDVLGVADNLRRALDALTPELRQQNDTIKPLLEGVELTERELLKMLEKYNITRFDPQGEKFNPNLHQAMFEVSDPSVPPGTVVQVVQPGFKIADRVLRPALVGVSKGGIKPATSETPTNDNMEPGADS
jgi:molecular chaperone GrpE